MKKLFIIILLIGTLSSINAYDLDEKTSYRDTLSYPSNTDEFDYPIAKDRLPEDVDRWHRKRKRGDFFFNSRLMPHNRVLQDSYINRAIKEGEKAFRLSNSEKNKQRIFGTYKSIDEITPKQIAEKRFDIAALKTLNYLNRFSALGEATDIVEKGLRDDPFGNKHIKDIQNDKKMTEEVKKHLLRKRNDQINKYFSSRYTTGTPEEILNNIEQIDRIINIKKQELGSMLSKAYEGKKKILAEENKTIQEKVFDKLNRLSEYANTCKVSDVSKNLQRYVPKTTRGRLATGAAAVAGAAGAVYYWNSPSDETTERK